ncbi:trafficking protein particle complex subunit 11 isoform X2 [Impatiens glandulifera]|nr:trafficking protein particle complex subunit 11 isoform X2 [Impatiens glandulifera]
MTALKKRAEIDSKHIIIFALNNNLEMKESLNRLGSIFAELANTYYRDEGRKVKTRLERKSLSSVELSIRYCFKVAVYAEFRRDWPEALRMYEDAYQTLREMIGTTTKSPAIQWLIEIKTVAEQLHFKVSTLLLHGGKLTEAITWFRQHHASYKKLVGAPEVSFLHWEWLSRQFLVFAELLETSLSYTQSISSPVPGTKDRLTELEYRSSYYYQLAAHYLKEKKSCSEIALSMMETTNKSDNDVDSIVPSIYIGQYARVTEEGETCSVKRVTDEDYVRYALVEEKRSQDFSLIVVLLKRCFEAYNDLKAPRMASYCGFEMAREYAATGEFQSAKELLDSVASLYRKEGWVILLWDVLGYLRECSMKLGSAKDFVEYSLEMAALPVSSSSGVQPLSFNSCVFAGPPSLSQREMIQKEVFKLVRGESGEDNNCLKITDTQPLHLVIDLVSPLRAVLLASVAFHEQLVKPGAPTPMTISLLSQLPLTMEIDQLDIQFNQVACNFSVINGQRSKHPILESHPNLRIETAPSLTLSTNKWLRLTYDITSELGGKLECVSIIARNGPNFTICCIAESPASMSELPLWKFEDRVESSPIKDPSVSFSGQKAIQVEEPDPLVDLKLGVSGPALVGERFIIPVTISSKGHPVFSGELKINLVDVRGGGLFSPRDVEPSSMDNLHVELLGVSGLFENEDNNKSDDNIEKIQPTFGLISVPVLKEGESWTCKLEIRWRRPKPIMLYVSLGYSPLGSDNNNNKVHVHRNLEIEGKNPVLISHRFMLPFRKDPLLLSTIKSNPDQIPPPTLPLNETSILVITAKNVTEVPLRLLSMSIKRDDNEIKNDSNVSGFTLLQGDEFKKIFTVIPEHNQPKLKTGTLHLSWKRDATTAGEEVVLTEHKLPEVDIELPPIVVQLECPPHAILGNHFTYFIKIKNQTQLLQEIKYSLADSQSFVLSGTHNDILYVLPKSEHTLSYKLVPLVPGFQQLPRFTATSLRYSAGFQSSNTATSVFVFPSVPHFLKEKEGKLGLIEEH